MEFIKFIFDFILHIDSHLETMIQSYGLWTFGILWSIIFSETGLVFLPFLPGDSLLFAAGALSAKATTDFNVIAVLFTCITAAFIGNTVNYFIGQFFGEKILSTKFFKKIIKPEQLEKSHAFFEKHGV
ncbi:MAG: VTT domain-containing protein, partial [Culicoidibacterales bacterium]